MSFEFGGLTPKTKTKELGMKRKDPCLFVETTRNNDYQVIVVLDNFYPDKLTDSFLHWLKKNITVNYMVLVATTLECKAEELTQIVDYYNRNTIDFSHYIPKEFTNPVYVSVGRAIYSFTGSDELKVESFYDYIFNDTFFYSPKVKSYVFPIDYLQQMFKNMASSWVIQDSARAKFATMQLHFLANRFPSLEKAPPAFKKHILVTKKEVEDYLVSMMDYEGILALDTETSSLDFSTCKVRCITLCSDPSNAYYLEFSFVDKELFNKFISNKKVIGQNYKFDYKVLKAQGLEMPLPYSDTMVLAQTLNEMRGNSLKALSYVYSFYGGYENELDEFKKKFNTYNYYNIPVEVLAPYALMDAYVTFIIYERMMEQLLWIDTQYLPIEGEKTVKFFFEEIMLPSFREFCLIEWEGMYVDKKRCDDVSNQIMNGIEKLTKEIYESFNADPMEFELTSAQQLGKFIENKLGWTCYGRRKDKIYSTGEEQLVRWAKEGHKEASLIQKFRSLNTLLGMFVGKPDTDIGWREYFKTKDNYVTTKMHPSYGVGMAASKRNTSNEPNFQQVPAHGVFSDEIKSIITVPPPVDGENFVFGTLDYASLQIRLCALDSDDSFLCNLYKKDSDPDLHSTTGYELVKDNQFNFIKIVDGDKEHNFYELQPVLVIRDGKRITVEAREIKETDLIGA